jgi:hypothetical protein
VSRRDETRELVQPESALPPVNSLLRILLGPPGGEASADAVTRVIDGQAADAEARVDGLASDLPSRLEDVIPAQRRGAPTQLLIAAPRYGGDSEPPPPLNGCALVWATGRGVIELPVRYVDSENARTGVRVWRLDISGMATRIQRREFVRVPFCGPVAVTTRREQTFRGEMIDLSEGGLRCLLPGPALPGDLPVTVSFATPDQEFELHARVVRAVPSRSGPPAGSFGPWWETAIRFTDVGHGGDDLRKAVFAEQLRQRRAALD